MSRRQKDGSGIEVTLPITQFLDMAFQLLFFFMATFNPSPVEGNMDLALAGEPPMQGPAGPRTRLIELEDRLLDLTVEVKSETVGYSLTLVEAGVRTPITTDDPTKTLEQRLRQKWQEREKAILVKAAARDARDREAWIKTELANQGVKVAANAQLRWDCLIEVMDRVKKSGWQSVTLEAPYHLNMRGD
jgi:biopolymer transport protein ExbD